MSQRNVAQLTRFTFGLRALARRALLLIACGFLGLVAFPEASAQSVTVRLAVVAPGKVRVEIRLPVDRESVSFRNTYGEALGLGERIDCLEAKRGQNPIKVKKLAAGEYQAESGFDWLSYEVNVSQPVQPAQMSRVSWFNGVHGLLMMADLLPRLALTRDGVVDIFVGVPSHHDVATNIPGSRGRYLTTDPAKAVFMVGPFVRQTTRRVGATKLSLITSSKWTFSESDALKISEKLIQGYSKVTGHVLQGEAAIFLLPFPGDVGPERWTAETRGNAVVLLLGQKAERKRLLAKLGIMLSHELFHLWVPNALAMEGDYDWFFEGFTLYQALTTSLKLGLISFDTYLDTMARVYDSYLRSAERDRVSLIEASERRWTTSSSLVYDKGMLVAFFYDLTLKNLGNCQVSLDDVYRQLFQRRAAGHEGANETIINLLSELSRTESFRKEYIEGRGPVDMKSILAPYGIEVIPSGAKGTKLKIADNLTTMQRTTLRCIGHHK